MTTLNVSFKNISCKNEKTEQIGLRVDAECKAWLLAKKRELGASSLSSVIMTVLNAWIQAEKQKGDAK